MQRVLWSTELERDGLLRIVDNKVEYTLPKASKSSYPPACSLSTERYREFAHRPCVPKIFVVVI